MTRLTIILGIALLFAVARAQAGPADVPEPSDLSLFLLGLTGLIIGRRAAMRRRRDRGEN